MQKDRKLFIKILDSAILILSLIFVLTLTNSIFVNQLGYFGTLFLLLIRYAITKENQFRKTGLEIALLLYLLAVVMSTIFSDDFSHSLNNLSKRILLIPVVYTMIAVVIDLKRGKLFFNFYIASALITVIVYLYFSFDYFMNNLYGITQSGPSLFQYPITASEIMSFLVVYLFAFLVNEKSSFKIKILQLAGFLISSLALIATYKRTGWIGAALGILVILIARKQWKTIFAGIILLIIILQFEKNISEINVYDTTGSNLKELYKVETDGRAINIFHLDGYQVVCEYENGISIYQDSQLISNQQKQAPVISISKLNDEIYVAFLVDTRFLFLRKEGLNFNVINEITPPGYTVNYKTANGLLYVLDSDSGLTVYEFENEIINYKNYKQFADFKFLFVDPLNIYLSSVDSGLVVYSLNNNLPDKEIFSEKKKNLEYLFLHDKLLLSSYPDGINYFKIDKGIPDYIGQINSINNVRIITNRQSGFYIVKGAGELVELKIINKDSLVITRNINLGFIPNSINFKDEKLFTTFVKRSRLLSIFDPYIPSNFNRLALWRAGIKIFKDHPIFGVGDIDLQYYYKQYKRPQDKEIQGHMHNNFMHFLVTLGLFGLLALLFLFTKMIVIDYKIYKQVKEKRFFSSVALGTLGSFCGILAAGLTEMNFWDHEVQTMIWFTFGLNFALFLISKKEENKSDEESR